MRERLWHVDEDVVVTKTPLYEPWIGCSPQKRA
jgi:hypothetical protein